MTERGAYVLGRYGAAGKIRRGHKNAELHAHVLRDFQVADLVGDDAERSRCAKALAHLEEGSTNGE